jgi:hypothetical protein
VSSRVFKPGRCAHCKKPEDHDVHQVEESPGLLHRLLHLAWPRWMWSVAGRHQYVDRDRMVAAKDEMAANRRWLKKARRLKRRRR